MRATMLAIAALFAGTALAQPNLTAWNVLIDGFNDKKLERRQQALTAIGSIGPTPDTTKLLEKALRDADPLIRQTAAAVMGQMKFRESIPALKAALHDESGEVAFTAAKALWQMGDRSGKDIIQEVLSGERKDAPGLVDSAKRDANAKLHNPKSLALMGVKEASGALLGPFSIGIYAAERAFKDGSAGGPRSRRNNARPGLRYRGTPAPRKVHQRRSKLGGQSCIGPSDRPMRQTGGHPTLGAESIRLPRCCEVHVGGIHRSLEPVTGLEPGSTP